MPLSLLKTRYTPLLRMTESGRGSFTVLPSLDPLATRRLRRVTWMGLVVNLLLSATKMVAGLVGQSQALVADAVHSLSDCASDIAVVVGSYYWSQPPDEDHPYGHRRIETFITILIGVLTGLVGVFLTWEAVLALKNIHRSSPTVLAGAAAGASIVTKELLYRWTMSEGRRLRSTAVQANAWHHRSDAISSVPVLLAIVGAMVFPEVWFLDQLGAVVVSGFIIKAAVDIVRPGMRELVDTGAPPEVYVEIRRLAIDTEGVLGVHDVRTRYVGAELCIDLHIEVGGNITVNEGHHVATRVIRRLKAQGPHVVDVMVHIDPDDDSAESLAPSGGV